MDPDERYERWLSCVTDMELLRELLEMAHDETAIEDSFYRDLEFGTGGLRGILGAGSNRMNVLTVGKASQGYADYLNGQFPRPSVAVSYDSRRNSLLFARTAAGVFAANGIRVHIYHKLMPTPALSFAVRALGCSGGVMITASHNPAEYNGYKVYGADGCQITTEAAARIQEHIDAVDPFDSVRTCDFDAALADGMISYIPSELCEAYIGAVAACSLAAADLPKDLRLVYTPLNGTGISVVPALLSSQGYKDVIIPRAQQEPDGDFPTCPSPNPENRSALELGIATAKEQGADLVLATDPDCDRVGCAVRRGDDFVLLNGNEMGVLLLDYVCRRLMAMGSMPDRPVAVKTIVTTPMAAAVAEYYGVELRNVLTGFKFIGEQIGFLEEEGRAEDYIFGFEESYGYLSGSYVRDKDAANAVLLICEMACEYAQKGMSLSDGLETLYQKFGYYETRLLNYSFKGSAGQEKMEQLMEELRRDSPRRLGEERVLSAVDHLNDDTGLPASNVLRFLLQDAEAVVRPSGTEPKLKVYLTVGGGAKDLCKRRCDALEDHFNRWTK